MSLNPLFCHRQGMPAARPTNIQFGMFSRQKRTPIVMTVSSGDQTAASAPTRSGMISRIQKTVANGVQAVEVMVQRRRLVRAIRKNNLEKVQTRISQIPQDQLSAVLQIDNITNSTAFWAAFSTYCNPDIILALWHCVPPQERVKALNQADHGGRTLLHWAAYWSNEPKVFQGFLNSIPQPDQVALIKRPDHRNQTPLSTAIDRSNPQVVKALLAFIPTPERFAFITQDGLNSPFTMALREWQNSFQGVWFRQGQHQRIAEVVQRLLESMSVQERADFFKNPPQPVSKFLRDAIRSCSPNMINVVLSSVDKTRWHGLLNPPVSEGRPLLQLVEQYDYAQHGLLPQNFQEQRYLMAGILQACGAESNLLVPDVQPERQAFLQAVQDFLSGQTNQHLANLININPNTPPEQVCQAMQWFQQFPKGCSLLNSELITRPCQDFIQAQVDALKALDEDLKADKLQKISRLARCRPVLRSGVSIKPELLDAIAKYATSTGYWDAVHDALQAGASNHSMSLELIKTAAPARQEPNQGSLIMAGNPPDPDMKR